MKCFEDERNNPSCDPGLRSGPRELIKAISVSIVPNAESLI